ncbi:MAG: hypothetical protein JXR03_18470 [Cyclobacteriaceae bacterium]
MITTNQADQEIEIRKTTLISDLSIFRFWTNRFWSLLGEGSKKAIPKLLQHYLKASAAMSSFCVFSPLKWNWGQLTCGLLLTAWSTSTLLVLNSAEIHGAFTMFAPIIIMVLPFFKNVDELYHLFVIESHSLPLFFWILLHFLISVVHVVRSCWLGYGAQLTKRGTSFLYMFLNWWIGRRVRVNEYFVDFFQALAITTLGACLVGYDIDPYFGIVLALGGVNECFLLLLERTARLRVDRILHA